MIVYFDKENFLSFIKNIDRSSKDMDVLRLVKNQVNVHFNFDPESLDDDEFILVEEFQEGVSENWQWTYGNDAIKRPINEDSFPIKNGIYLLNDKNLNREQNKHKYLIGGVNEEIETLKQLLLDKDDYGFHIQELIGIGHFDNWDKIEPYCLPFSTLLIVDRYMFKGPDLGGNISLFEYNLKIIIANFFKNKKSKARVIFVYQINPFVANNSPQFDEGPDFQNMRQKVVSAVRSKNRYCPAPEIIFIGVPHGRIEDEHDRNIITNYLRIKSGDTLVYFKANGIVETNSNDFDIYSLGKRLYRFNTEVLNDKIRDIVIETIDRYPDRCYLDRGITRDTIFNF